MVTACSSDITDHQTHPPGSSTCCVLVVWLLLISERVGGYADVKRIIDSEGVSLGELAPDFGGIARGNASAKVWWA